MAEYRQNLSNDSRYYTTLTIEETDEGQVRTLTYLFTATKTSGSGYYSTTGNNQVTVTIDGENVVNKKISYDFTGSTPKTITLASGTLTSNKHTFTNLEIPIYSFFDMSGTGRGTATINSSFELNQLHEPPYNVTYTITETNQDLLDVGITDSVFVQNLSRKEFYFTAEFNDGETYGNSRVYNIANPINWVVSESGSPRTCVYDCSQELIFPYNVVEPPQLNKVAILGAVFDTLGSGKEAFDSSTSNPDIYDFIPYTKVYINDNSLYFKRYGQTTGRARVSLAGTYYNGVVGNVDQSGNYKPTVKYKYWKLGDTEPSTYDNSIPSENITIDNANSTFTIYRYDIGTSDETQSNFLDPEFSWQVKFKVSDAFTSYESSVASIKKGFYLWAELKDRVDFLKLTIKNKEIFPNLYLTDETIIGEYLGKPLYRKVIVIDSLNSSGLYNHRISDLESLPRITGYAVFGTGTNKQIQPIQRVVTDAITRYGIGIGDVTSTQFFLQIGTSYTNFQRAEITFEYTKDTD